MNIRGLVPPSRPQRLLAASNLVFTIGSGIYLTAGVLYFTEAAGLPAAQVGLGLGIAGAVALLQGVVGGRLADRHGARGVYAVTLIVQAVAMAAFLPVHTFWPFVAAVAVAGSAKTAGMAARSPLISRYGGGRPQEFRAYLRAVTNLGVSGGAALAGVAVQVGTLTAFRLMVVGMVLGVAASAVFLIFLPAVPPSRTSVGLRWDRPYLLITALDGVMAIQFKVLTVAVPLWILGATEAPAWTVSATMITATLIVVLFQVRASRGIDTPRSGGTAYRRAGLAFLLSCALVPISAMLPGWAAAALLIGAMVIHTVGEMWHAAGGFELSFALAPPDAIGQYLGVFGLGAGLAETVGPALIIALCITWGAPGWYVLGALLAVTGLLMPAAVRRAGQPVPQPAAHV